MVIKKAVTAAMVLLAAGMASSVQAAKGFSYSYADFGYLRQNFDTSDTPYNVIHEDGVAVDGAFGIYKYVSLRAQFGRGRLDLSGDSISETRFAGGLLGHFPIVAKKLDVYGEFLYFNSKLNNSNVRSNTDLGADYTAGLRFQALKKLELDAGYHRIGGNLDEGFGTVAALFRVTKKLDLVGKAEFGTDDDERYFAGVRLNF